jgi:hypothetical protein
MTSKDLLEARQAAFVGKPELTLNCTVGTLATISAKVMSIPPQAEMNSMLKVWAYKSNKGKRTTS